MSTKAALILGDYSNGWGDAVIVQLVTKFPKIDSLNADREFVTKVMSKHLNDTITELEGNEKINPLPLDETCCDKFQEWAKDLEKTSSCLLCPFCGVRISDERRKKFIGRGF